ncbi:oligopeptide ABC transporter substrate-binding protein [Levilactobacillus yonginensis]|uniref:oligopeptide ABC transporter substrate-binding protein n=1 Tax=Levilactobacillus yonginensis TaxID=1054041 RepID=UPI00345C73E6
MKKNKIVLSTMALLAVIGLAACSKKSSSSNSSGEVGSSINLAEIYHNPKATDQSATKNSTLKIAEPNSAPFQGLTDPSLITNAEDTDVFAPGGNQPGNIDGLFNYDKDFKIVDGGLANQRLNLKDKTATITIRKDGKWSNGMPVTAKDIEYAYEVIGNKNTTSQQYSSDFNAIKGMAAYHAGTAKTIPGITFPDGPTGKVAVIHFDKMSPSMKYIGNTFIWGAVEPYEYIKNVPIAKLAASAQIRKNPLFTGPYKLDKVVEGESTSWSPNKYYYGKTPQIQHITITVVSPNNIDKAIQSGKYDFTSPAGIMRGTDYKELKNLKNYTPVGQPELGYGYFGFNVGQFDTKAGKNVMNPKSKMANKNLRQAMMYALNLDAVNKKFGNGITWRANSLIPPIFAKYWDSSAKGYPYNLSKANKLLDEAGYKKKGKWRVQPNGKPLTIYFGAMTETSVQAAEYQDYLQQWHKVGLNVKLATGKTMEMNSFYNILQQPKQDKMDIFDANFSLSSEPTPTTLYGQSATFNFSHFVEAKNDKLISEMNNSKSWNDTYRTKIFKEWQEYMNEEAYVVPKAFNYTWAPVNHRVKGYDISNGNSEFWSNLSLTSNSLE